MVGGSLPPWVKRKCLGFQSQVWEAEGKRAKAEEKHLTIISSPKPSVTGNHPQKHEIPL